MVARNLVKQTVSPGSNTGKPGHSLPANKNIIMCIMCSVMQTWYIGPFLKAIDNNK